MAGESVHRPSGPQHGTVRCPRGSSRGTESTAAASSRNRKCHVSPLCLRGRRLRPGPPSSPGSAAASEPGVPSPAGLTPEPLRALAGSWPPAGRRDRVTRHASTLTRHPRVFRSSSLQIPALRFPVGALRLGAAVDPDGSVLPRDPRAPWPSPGSPLPAAPQLASRPRTELPQSRGLPTPTVSAARGRGGRHGSGPGQIPARSAAGSGR